MGVYRVLWIIPWHVPIFAKEVDKELYYLIAFHSSIHKPLANQNYSNLLLAFFDEPDGT